MASSFDDMEDDLPWAGGSRAKPPAPVGLLAVLAAIDAAQTPEALRAASEAAATLEPADKEIARWVYAYHREQHRGNRVAKS